MSYVLELKPRMGGAQGFLGALRHALRALPASEDLGDVIDYVNDDTDVHFMFELGPLDTLAPEDAPATLVLNFARPSPFVREAAAVMERIARNMPLLVRDVQEDEDWGPFDADRFIATYTDHAGRAVSSLMRSMDDHSFAQYRAPRVLLDYVWDWNTDRAAKDKRRKADGRNIWVPKLEFVEIESRLFTYVGWFDGVATLFPKSELVGATRSKYPAKSSGPFGLGAKRPTLEFIPRASADRIMGDTYQADPVWPDAVSPTVDGGRAGQDRFLARPVGADVVCDPIFLDRDDYRKRAVKPFRRVKFHDVLDAEFFAD